MKDKLAPIVLFLLFALCLIAGIALTPPWSK